MKTLLLFLLLIVASGHSTTEINVDRLQREASYYEGQARLNVTLIVREKEKQHERSATDISAK